MKWIQRLKCFFIRNDKKKDVKFIDRYDIRELPDIPDDIYNESKSLKVVLASIKADPFLKLKLIYDFLDRYSQFASTFTVCTKGCSACCKINVNMTALEASYIEKNTSHRIINNKPRKPKTNTDCPFLISGNCSVYEFRPFNCRTFFTIDNPKYCKTPDEPHQVHGSGGGQGVPVLYQFREYIDRLNGKREVADIRCFFGRNVGSQ